MKNGDEWVPPSSPFDFQLLSFVFSDNRNAADVLKRETAEIVRQTEPGIGNLALVRAAVELQVHFVEHSQPRRADGMAETFQPAVHLAGDLAV